MAKHRKTRVEKLKADLRHKFQHQEVAYAFEAKPTFSKSTTEIKTYEQPTPTTTAYPYLIKDLTKTVTLTGIIVAAQIVLFLLLKFNLIKLFGLTY